MAVLDVGRALVSPFRGPDWRWRLAGAALLAIIPLLGWWLLAGYGMRIARRAGRGEEDGLPPWDDWGGLVVDGGRLILIAIVWALPLIPLLCVFIVVMIPFLMVGAIVEAEGGPGAFPPDLLVGPLLFLAVVLSYAMFVYFVVPAAFGRAAVFERADAGLQFGETVRLVTRRAPLFLAVFVAQLGTYQLIPVFSIVPLLGIVLAFAYLVPVQANLCGQAIREAYGWAMPGSASLPPSPPVRPLDVERAVGEVLAPGWVGRLAGAAALVAVPVVGWVILLGYAARLTRRAAGGFVAPRPNWDRAGELIGDGLRYLVVLVIWGVPVWTVQIWSWRQSAIEFRQVWQASPSSQPPTGFVPFSLPEYGALTLLGALGVVAMSAVPAAMAQVAVRRSFEAGFDLPVLWQTARRQPLRYAAAVAVQLGSVGLISYGLLLFGIGALVAAGFAALLNGYLYGELVMGEKAASVPAPTGAG